MKVIARIQERRIGLARLAKEGETPTHSFVKNFGKAAPSLFENIEACRPFFGKLDQSSFFKLEALLARKRMSSGSMAHSYFQTLPSLPRSFAPFIQVVKVANMFCEKQWFLYFYICSNRFR